MALDNNIEEKNLLVIGIGSGARNVISILNDDVQRRIQKKI